jgi:D-alanyl-lipoteichoic acid acyltransferase DltB (MBOAT superfamily)
MGIDLMLNFNNPYLALNPKEFWQRWHISLSTWLRDYLYIPLGGSRKGTARTYVNLLLTMILGGLWHGAAWTFVAWGVYHGALLVGYHAWMNRFLPGKRMDSGKWVLVRRVVLFHLVCLGWLFFRAVSLGQARHMLSSMVMDFSWNIQAANMLTALVFLCLPLWGVQLLQAKSGDLEAPLQLSTVPRMVLYAVLLLLFLWLGHTGGGAFIYFQF